MAVMSRYKGLSLAKTRLEGLVWWRPSRRAFDSAQSLLRMSGAV